MIIKILINFIKLPILTKNMEEKLFDIIFKEDEIQWQQMIYQIVKEETMDPWDIDISKIAVKFMELLKKMQEMDLKISGKVILAAAILLKLKSVKFLESDMVELDKMFLSVHETSDDEIIDEGDEEVKEMKRKGIEIPNQPLIPRTPQPRKRKVSVYDLVNALEDALSTKNRRILRELSRPRAEKPEKKYDITELINHLLNKINLHFGSNTTKLTFDSLVPSKEKHDIIMTFVPLLHLSSMRKIDLEQEKPFGEIEIKLVDSTPIEVNINSAKGKNESSGNK